VIGAQASIDDNEWNIVGQIHRPKQLNERSFAWHAIFPADTFVPPHFDSTQDEYVYVLDGELTLAAGEADHVARTGDLVRLPMGQPHGLFTSRTRSRGETGRPRAATRRCSMSRPGSTTRSPVSSIGRSAGRSRACSAPATTSISGSAPVLRHRSASGKPGLSLASPKKILYEKKAQTHDPGYPQKLHSSW
jgi:mannose-6-phosphate isomerase-like protein (cupin superfamily)